MRVGESTVLTALAACSIAVKTSSLYKCTQKSASSSWARTLRISQPAARLSMLLSVSVSVRTMWTTCSRRSSLRHLASWTMLAMAPAAAVLDLASGLCRSFSTGRILLSRSLASSGSDGGFTGFAMGSLRLPRALLRRDLPMFLIEYFQRRPGFHLLLVNPRSSIPSLWSRSGDGCPVDENFPKKINAIRTAPLVPHLARSWGAAYLSYLLYVLYTVRAPPPAAPVRYLTITLLYVPTCTKVLDVPDVKYRHWRGETHYGKAALSAEFRSTSLLIGYFKLLRVSFGRASPGRLGGDEAALVGHRELG